MHETDTNNRQPQQPTEIAARQSSVRGAISALDNLSERYERAVVQLGECFSDVLVTLPEETEARGHPDPVGCDLGKILAVTVYRFEEQLEAIEKIIRSADL